MKLYQYKDNPLYEDRYERNKKWVKILFAPGRPLQSSELIELQSLLHDQQKQILNTLYKPGTILSGLEVYKKEDNGNSITLIIESGSIYVEGYVIDIESTDVLVNKEGSYKIGILIKEYIIDEKDDPSLRLGGNSYGIEGAARLLWEGEVTINDNDSIEIARVEGGNIIQFSYSRKSKLEEQLTQYLRDKDGSFIVNGMEVLHIDSIKADVNNALLINNDRSKEKLLDEKKNKVKDIEDKLLDIGTRIANLRLKLTEDSQALNLRPTPTNLSKVQATLSEIETLSNTEELLKEQLNTAKLELAESISSNTSLSRRLDKEVLAVNPGLAYINGHRVLLTNPKSISVDKNLSSKSVEGVKFLYKVTSTSFSSALISNDISSIVNEKILLSIKNLIPNEVINLSFNIDTSYLNTNDLVIAFIDSIVNENSLRPIASSSLLSSINNYLTFKVGANNGLLIIEATDNLGVLNPIEIRITTTASVNQLYWDVSYGVVKKSNVSNDYKLDNKDILTTSNFISDLKEERWQVTRSSNGITRDYIGEDSVFKLLNVTNINGNVLYKQGLDYSLEGQSNIIWLSDNRPPDGSTYFIDYIYTDKLTEDIDFTINKDTGVIRFIGRTPAPGYTFSLSYTYSLPKTIYIYIDENASIFSTVNIISENSDSYLYLAKVVINSQTLDIYPVDNKALTSKELYYLNENLKKNIRLLNQLELDIETYNDIQDSGIEEPIASFSDSLDNLDRININESQFSISVTTKSISNLVLNNTIKVNYLSGGVVHYNSQFPNTGDYVSLPFLTTDIINQNRATRYRNLSPSNKKQTCRGRMYLDKDIYPSAPSFLYPGEPIIIENITKDSSLKTTYEHNKSFIYCPIYENLKDSLLNNYYLMDEVLTYISNRNTLKEVLEVEVLIEDLLPNEDNLNLYLNNQKLDIEAQVTTFNGTIRGLLGIRANNQGIIHVRLKLFNVPIGSNILELKGLYSYASSSFIVGDITLIKYLSNVCQERIPFNQVSRSISLPYIGDNQHLFPSLSQEFIVQKDIFITDILLRFRQVGEGELELSIREEGLNGLPSKDILVIGKPINGIYWYDEFGTQSTTFNLDYPFYLKAYKKYYLSINVNNIGFDIFTSQVGEKDILDGNRIGFQLLNSGGLILSINGETLSKYQDEDLSFVLKGAMFRGNQLEVIELGKYKTNIVGDIEDISHFSYFSKDIIPLGTDIKYQYRTSSNSEWKDFNVNSFTKLTHLVSFIEIRAILINGSSSDNTNLSPLLDINNAFIVLSSPKNNGIVRYKSITYPERFNNIRISLEVYEPPGSLIRVFLGNKELVRESSIPLDNYPSMEVVLYSLYNLDDYIMDITITLFIDRPDSIPFYRNFKSYVW